MKNGFEKGFFKLMTSAVCEKTMKALDKIVDMGLVFNKRKFLKFVNMEDIQLESIGSV